MINLLLLLPILGILRLLSQRKTDPYGETKQKQKQKELGLKYSLLTFLVSLTIWATFDTTLLSFQFIQEYTPLYFFELNLGIDGISLPFVLLTTLTMPICLMSSWNNIKVEIKHFLIAFLLLEILLLTVFLSLDLLLFYVFFESVLPPLFLIIGVWGHGKNRVRASYLLFLYTLIGSLFMLLSILGFILVIGSSNYHLLFLTDLTAETQFILWLGFFIALAVKTPLFPFHIWLYRAHAEAPLAGSVLLAGVILKLATYGYIRVLLAMLPESTFYFIPFVQGISVITILYSALTTLRQTDIKCCIAYSSVTHMGFVVLALCSNTIQGIEGAIILSIAHGLVSPALFICVGGVLYDRYKTRIIKYYRGLTLTMPIFSTFLFIFILGNISVPLSLNFVGEFLALTGSYIKNPTLTIFAALGMVLGACYSLWLYNRVGFGPFSQYLVTTNDVTRREFNILLTLALLTFLFGIFPNSLLDLLHTSVTELLFNVTETGSLLFGSASITMFKRPKLNTEIESRSMSSSAVRISGVEPEDELEIGIDKSDSISINSQDSAASNDYYGKYSTNKLGDNSTSSKGKGKEEYSNTEEEKIIINDGSEEFKASQLASEQLAADMLNEQAAGLVGAVLGSYLGAGSAGGAYAFGTVIKGVTKHGAEQIGFGTKLVEQVKVIIPENFVIDGNPPSPTIFPQPHAVTEMAYFDPLFWISYSQEIVLNWIHLISGNLEVSFAKITSLLTSIVTVVYNQYYSNFLDFAINYTSFLLLLNYIKTILMITLILVIILTILITISLFKLVSYRLMGVKYFSKSPWLKVLEIFKKFDFYKLSFTLLLIIFFLIGLFSSFLVIKLILNIAIKILIGSPYFDQQSYILPLLLNMEDFIGDTGTGLFVLAYFVFILYLSITLQELDIEKFLYVTSNEVLKDNKVKGTKSDRPLIPFWFKRAWQIIYNRLVTRIFRLYKNFKILGLVYVMFLIFMDLGVFIYIIYKLNDSIRLILLVVNLDFTPQGP